MTEIQATTTNPATEAIVDLTVNQELEDLLVSGELVEITFVKANGERRVMECVGKPEDVGIDFEYSNDSTHKASPGTRTVWDIANGGWRSFRWDRLESFEVITGA